VPRLLRARARHRRALTRKTAGRPLAAAFYDRPPATVARELLGRVLEHTTPAGRAAGRIVETEAYLGPHDPASHSAVGLTKRTRWVFGAPGTAYVFFIYGRNWCFNTVTEPVGVASAVLIRALEPVEGLALMRARRPLARRDRDLTNGPGKLCAALDLDDTVNGYALQRGPVVIRSGTEVADADVVVTPRIGISKAVEWPHRYLVRDNPYVSATPAAFPRAAYG
jgi:DNA-3-methyladenine glycosylase